MTPPVIAAVAAAATCLVAFDVFCLADLVRSGQVSGLPKWIWAIIICASNPWGGLAYLCFGRVGRPAEPGVATGSSPPPAPQPQPLVLRPPGGGQRSPVTIEANRLTKRFGSVTAVDGLTFTIRPGQVTGFLGPNGAGKTTTMRLILGLDAPTSGTALVGGRQYRGIIRPLRLAGALLDASAMHPGRSGYAHLLSLAESNGIGRQRVTEVLRVTGMDTVSGRRVRDLSLGMKQRLGIAAALLGDPPVLIFDEPVNGLDAQGVQWIRQFFRSLAAEGRTVFVSSHLMSEMAQTADHLIIIGRGRLLADMPTSQFIESSARRDVLIRSPQAAGLARLLADHGAIVRPENGGLAVTGLDAPAIADLAAAHGIGVHELTPRLASLEDAYLDITTDSVEYRAGVGTATR
jgi:ABC-2 type transport system ATP-binding protein